MKNNKGYTLVELLLSIAIFSVVMISIVSIMRSASISYRDESAEINLQENAQILLSQLEEMMVDCKDFNKSGNTYTIKDNSDKNSIIKYENKKIMYSYNGSAYEELASGVETFSINNFQKTSPAVGTPTVIGDNLCSISVKLSQIPSGKAGSKTYTYEATKDIAFRNNVENDPKRGSNNFWSGSTTTTTSDPNEKSLVIGRYELVDLYALYGFDKTKAIKITYTGTAGYNFVDEANLDATTKAMNSITKLTLPASGTSNYTTGSVYLTTSDVCEYNTGLSYSMKIEGKDVNNGDLKINVSTKVVALQKGTGIIEVNAKSVNDGVDGGFYSYLLFDGFCFRDYYKYNADPSHPNDIFVNGSLTSGSTTITGKIKSNRDNIGDTYYGKFNFSGCSDLNCGLMYDYFNSDTLCFMIKNGFNDPGASKFDSGTTKIKVRVNFPSQGGTDYVEETYQVFLPGSNLEKLD